MALCGPQRHAAGHDPRLAVMTPGGARSAAYGVPAGQRARKRPISREEIREMGLSGLQLASLPTPGQ